MADENAVVTKTTAATIYAAPGVLLRVSLLRALYEKPVTISVNTTSMIAIPSRPSTVGWFIAPLYDITSLQAPTDP